jgi:hypothetical protein
MHLTRKRRRFNLQASIDLGSLTKDPVQEVRVLGLWINPKLQWTAHRRRMRDKLAKQVNALNRLTGITWGFPLVHARQVYTAVIRPAVFYAAAVWH